ncbi:hypothetical protein MOKP4_34900 [Mycobacterium avium subsp. hominissuis]|nr:K+-transporting ATPase, KdpF subunit [Mycobacterium avium subsp. paratuberculosis]
MHYGPVRKPSTKGPGSPGPINFKLTSPREPRFGPARRSPFRMQVIGAERRQDGRGGVSGADRGGVRGARRGPEAGRTAMNYQNTVGLVLSILIALFLAGALLFPERF